MFPLMYNNMLLKNISKPDIRWIAYTFAWNGHNYRFEHYIIIKIYNFIIFYFKNFNQKYLCEVYKVYHIVIKWI